jgi:predicted MPP superfamily phosphohydrolase
MKSRLRALAAASPARVILFSTIWLSLFVYAGRPILAGAAVAGASRAVAWSVLIALSMLPLLPLTVRRGHLTGYTILGVFSTLLVLVFVGDVVRGGYALARWATSAQTWPLLDPRAVSLTILGASGALSLVGLLQARCPRTRHVTVAIDELPPELEGYRIVQWSDVHIGPTIRRRFVQSLVEKTNALAADAIAITGDLVDGSLAELRDEVEPMRELRARDGVFYVTGNHEYYWDADEWIAALEQLGVVFLKNAHRVIARADARLVIAGVTDPVGRGTHTQDIHAALRGAPGGLRARRSTSTILLSHRPQTAKDADVLGVHLQLSGHTHGGQFFPWNLMIRRFQPVVAGLHRIGRTWLYVNRGTGYWGPPSRLAVGGEITVIELTRG